MIKFLILGLLLLSGPNLYANTCHKLFRARTALNLTNSHIAKELKSGEILRFQPLADFLESHGIEYSGSNKETSFIIEYKSGIRAVFKADEDFYGAIGEVSAYLLSEKLGLNLVPPTVIRKINGSYGSVQYFIEWSLESGKMRFQDRWALVPEDLKANLAIFYFLIGQWDRHTGNVMVSATGDAFMIDNEHIMTSQRVIYGQMPFLKRGRKVLEYEGMIFSEQFPFDKVQKLSNPSEEEFQQIFGAYLPTVSLRNIWSKFKNNKYPNDEIPYLFWNNGVWIQKSRGQFGVDFTEVYPATTLEALRQIKFLDLRNILPKEYPDDLIHDLLERRDQLLSHERSLHKKGGREAASAQRNDHKLILK